MISTKSTRLAIAIAILLAAFQLLGCVTTLTAEERYEEQALRAERMDEIRDFITACEGAGMKAVYYGPTTNKLRNPIKYVPRHAHPSDYTCASQRDIDRAMRESGLRM